VNARYPKALFPILRCLADGSFHSGQDMAREFRISRASVFNALKQADAMGAAIYAVRGRGYKLAAPIDWLVETEIRKHLGRAGKGFDLQIRDSVDSTNSELMRAAQSGAPEGTVVCAEHQYAGKGRRGRPWHGVLGGSLVFSVLWHFDRGLQSMVGLSLAVGLAVARAINRHSRHAAQLKWPNDVLAGHRKLAGILVEVQGDLYGLAHAVVGIGLNVRLDEAQRGAIDQAVIDLSEMGVTLGRNQLLAACLQELQAVMSVFREQGFAALREDWMALDAYAGRTVSLRMPNMQAVQGVSAGVDATGALLLRDLDAARVQAYHGGEISLRLTHPR
jgi:BirA family biotin operon repressor/biotin-[acetyl-CoA-carboxylase] ligase